MRLFKGHQWGMVILLCGWGMTCSAQTLVDPTRPPHFKDGQAGPVEEQKSTSLRLNMVRTTGRKRMAMINGKMFNKGDEVGSAKIINITGNSVELLQDGEAIILTMNTGKIKMPSKNNADDKRFQR